MKDAAIGIVFHPQKVDHVLWVKRRDIPIWVLPGGGIDGDESPESAVIREVEEESELRVKITRKAALYSPINRFTAPTHLFICQILQGEPKPTQEAIDVGFFPWREPPKPHFPLHNSWLKEAMQNPHQLIQRPITDFSWWKVAAFFLRHPLLVLRYLSSRR